MYTLVTIQDALTWTKAQLESSKVISLLKEDIRKKSHTLLRALLQKDPSFCIAYSDPIVTQEEWEIVCKAAPKFEVIEALISENQAERLSALAEDEA